MSAKEKWASDVLEFWFETLGPKDWFEVNADTDAEIVRRFSGLHKRLTGLAPAELAGDRDTALAAIIVFDQFSRNMFRGSADAFAYDRKALELARMATGKGFDKDIADMRQMFFYMPFMHSEDLSDQDRCIELFTHGGGKNTLKHAREHRDIIARFGRFPHRNKVLGRANTAEETEFLQDHSGFGQ